MNIHPGRIVSRITSDTQDFGQLVTIVTDVASQVIEAVVLGVILWRIDWKLTLIILAFLPLLFIFGILFRKIARQGDPAGNARHGQRQRHHQGDRQRHRGGQEFPPGAEHLRDLQRRQPDLLPGELEARVHPQLGVPGAQRGWPGWPPR